jgi:hypothetical protein
LLENSNTHVASSLLLSELAVNNIAEFTKCMRMSPTMFYTLLDKVYTKIMKNIEYVSQNDNKNDTDNEFFIILDVPTYYFVGKMQLQIIVSN